MINSNNNNNDDDDDNNDMISYNNSSEELDYLINGQKLDKLNLTQSLARSTKKNFKTNPHNFTKRKVPTFIHIDFHFSFKSNHPQATSLKMSNIHLHPDNTIKDDRINRKKFYFAYPRGSKNS